jgi:rRNA small subunit pseudouridine methyltransferase Nep1
MTPTPKVTRHLVPIEPKIPKTKIEKENTRRLVVVLEGASLETYKVGKAKDAPYQLLDCDNHQNILKKLNKNFADYRPDITHQVRIFRLL